MHRESRRCKLDIWWSLGGDGMEMHVRTIFPWLGFIKGFLRRFRRTHGFIKSEKIQRTQIRDFYKWDPRYEAPELLDLS